MSFEEERERERKLIREVVREIIRDKIMGFLKRFCRCVQSEDEYRDILAVADKLHEIERALREKQELDLGVVRVVVKKKFLSKYVCLVYKGEEYCEERAELLLNRFRTIADWFRSDCDLNSIIAETIVNNDFNLLDFTYANLDKLRQLCRGVQVELDMSMLEDFAREAVENTVREYLSLYSAR